MAKRKADGESASSRMTEATRTSSSVEELCLAAMERGDDSFETGRYLITYREAAGEEGPQALGAQGMRVANARDFEGQEAVIQDVGDADALVFPEIGVALVGGGAAQERGLTAQAEIASDSPIESIDPELFVFAESAPGEYTQYPPGGFAQGGYAQGGYAQGGYAQGGFAPAGEDAPSDEFLRGFLRAAEIILKERQVSGVAPMEEEATALGATWGLTACRVPPSLRSGAGIKVAVLDTGMDLRHPDFTARLPVAQTRSFVGQPVQDLHSHGTHCIGTACGPRAPAGTTPRYGIGYRSSIFVGKVLANSGTSVGGSVLAGMNWAIANRCAVISMSLGSQSPPQPYYTAAGQAALNNGCLIVAASGNAASSTGAPANSPTIMSVASLDPNLRPSSFSNFGKVEIAAPGRDVFSSVPMPRRYGVMSGTSMATPHVAGCAALWAESSASLRGMALWRRLQASARRLPFPATRVGAGLVQAP